MNHLSAGEMDREITISFYLAGQDRLHAPIDVYINPITVWAKKVVLKAEAKNLNNMNILIADVEFHIYYNPDVDQNVKIDCDGFSYQMIQPPIEINRKEGIILRCRAHDFAKAV